MKGMLQAKTIRDIKSVHTAGMRCIPKVHRSAYLDLYMLKREKDQIVKEIEALNKRRVSAIRLSEDITKRINAVQKEIQKEEINVNGKQISSKSVKTITINY